MASCMMFNDTVTHTDSVTRVKIVPQIKVGRLGESFENRVVLDGEVDKNIITGL